MLKGELTSIVVLFYMTICFSQNQSGIWLTNVASNALDSKENLVDVVQNCKRIGIDNIYVVVWNRGYTLYPSDVMNNLFQMPVDPRFNNRDMLKELIEVAHSENIKVHAWFEFGFSSSYQELDGGHIIRAKPSWAAIDYEGNLVTKNGFQWMNAFNPEVQDFLLSLIKEVIEKYDIDGIQGDDRLPANPSTAGYDKITTDIYLSEHDGKSPPADYKDSDWIDWRANKLNHFMQLVHDQVKRLEPNMIISMAPSIFPWSKEAYLQDWPTWVENNWVDYVIPQVYRYTIKAYTETLDTNLSFMPSRSFEHFIPGILLKVDDYSPSKRFLKKMIKENRKRNINHEVFFFYEGLKDHDLFFNKKYKKIK